MKTALQTAFAYCLISTVACAAVAPHAKSEDGTLPDSCPASTFSATVWRGETAYVDIPAGVGSWSSELELESGGGDLVGVRGQGSGVSERIADIAKRYHFFPSVRDPSFDFKGFRREVESLVNDPMPSALMTTTDK